MKINRQEAEAALARWQFEQIVDKKKPVAVQYKRKGKVGKVHQSSAPTDRVFTMQKPKVGQP